MSLLFRMNRASARKLSMSQVEIENCEYEERGNGEVASYAQWILSLFDEREERQENAEFGKEGMKPFEFPDNINELLLT
jgi:hypothetical protein